MNSASLFTTGACPFQKNTTGKASRANVVQNWKLIIPPCFVGWGSKKVCWDKFLLRALQGIIARDKTSLDITWLKDKSLADLDNLPDPDTLGEEIVENLESALDGFRLVLEK